MSFIGIIGDRKNYSFIKNAIAKNGAKIDVIYIDNENIENIKNIKFDMIVVTKEINNMDTKQKYIEQIMKNVKYLLINSDIKSDMNILGQIKCQIITYGLNQKATITVSSVKEDNILVCIQRNIETINGNVIEEQECNIKSENINTNKIYNLLIIFTILEVYKENISKKNYKI